MTRNHTSLLVLFAFALLSALASGPVVAQTPDGETPALEDACETEAGAAFGLCNAYCEAMDCHLGKDLDSATLPSASDTACLKVERRFMQITDRYVPCDAQVCPPGTDGCACLEQEVSCEGELYCSEETLLCSADGGGDEH